MIPKLNAMIVAMMLLASAIAVLGSANASAAAVLEITTDKAVYEVGEPIVITVTNVGDEAFTYPSISQKYAITDGDGNYVVAPVVYCLWAVGFIGPGQSRTWTWDQTYWTDSSADYPDIPVGEQVPVGIYSAWFYDVGGAAGPVTFSIGTTSTGPINDLIQGLPDSAFKAPASERKAALEQKLDVVQKLIDAGDYESAIDKLLNDIVPKVDADSRSDWITDPAASAQVLELIYELIEYLETMP